MKATYLECVCKNICDNLKNGKKPSTEPFYDEIKDINGNPRKMTWPEHQDERETWGSPCWKGTKVMHPSNAMKVQMYIRQDRNEPGLADRFIITYLEDVLRDKQFRNAYIDPRDVYEVCSPLSKLALQVCGFATPELKEKVAAFVKSITDFEREFLETDLANAKAEMARLEGNVAQSKKNASAYHMRIMMTQSELYKM